MASMHVLCTANSAAPQARGARRRRMNAPLHHILQPQRVRALHLCAALGVRCSLCQGIPLFSMALLLSVERSKHDKAAGALPSAVSRARSERAGLARGCWRASK